MMMMMRSNSSSREEKNEKIKKMGFINSTTTNEWSQARRGGGGGGMLKQMKAQHPPPPPPPQQQQQEQLRCPRCDSSNTKFCYYNNYSLSQPRHFCKSCKRYWTRGGTLRNVPVGGGCRKNKRVKRSSTSVEAPASRAGDGNAPAMFSYGNPHSLDLPYALGFSSGIGGSFIRDFVMDPSSNSVVPGFGPSANFVQTSGIDVIPTTASPLLASTIFQEQQKFMSCGGLGLKEASTIGNTNSFKLSCPSENVVQVKFDEGHPVDWSVPQQDQFDEAGLTDLPVSCWNTIAGCVVVGSWLQKESGNNAGGPSIPSLI